ncbi:MAG: hypothetical protein ABI619_12200 [Betaproteobacteria bacterium]
MSADLLRVREHALEYEFFHKVDEELWRKLREKLEFDNRRLALAEATGINDDVVLDELVAAGISGETSMALSLFPLVWIAWSDGHIEPDERTAILAAAEEAGHLRDSASYHMIELWLDHRPQPLLQSAWQDYVHYLAKTMPPTAFQSFEQCVLRRSRQLADTICFRYGFHGAESAQDAVLDQIEATFRTTTVNGESHFLVGRSQLAQETH